jgi:hypothetical protein
MCEVMPERMGMLCRAWSTVRFGGS